MNAYFQHHFCTTHFPLISRLTVCSLLVSCVVMSNAFAEDIVWYGKGDPRNTGTLRLHPTDGFGESLFADGPSNNRVDVYGDVPDYIYGGFSISDDTSHNTVTITDSQFNAVNAGRSRYGDVSYNTLIISDSTVSTYIISGSTNEGAAMFNSVTMNNVTAQNSVWGGHTSGNHQAYGNSVNITNSTVSRDIMGGYSSDGGASNNSVTMTNSSARGDAVGGYAATGQSSNNSLVMTDSTVRGEALGGFTYEGDANNNSVIIDGSSYVVSSQVIGGLTYDGGDANNNSVSLSGNSYRVGYTIAGGYSGTGEASNNSVTISGGEFSGNVYGGYVARSNAAKATFNSVTLSGDALFSANSDIFGGFVDIGVGDVFTGNSLNIDDYHGSAVKDIANFQNYSFTLPASVQNGDTVLTANNVVFGNGAGLDSTVSGINIKGGGDALETGDSVTLISANFNGTIGNDGDVVHGAQGVYLLYDFLLSQNANSLDATVLSVRTNQQIKALSESRIAGLAFTNQGADLVAGAGLDAAANVAPDGEMSGFALMGGGWSRYDSGSHVDVYGASLLTGFASAIEKKSARYLGGVFFETGWGGYDSYNSLANMPSIDGDGDINYYGGGLLGRIDFDNVGPGTLSVDAAVRAGQTHTDFNSDDLSAQVGQEVEYKSRSYYVGAHTGLSYKLDMTERDSVKMYLRYLWTRQGSDDVTVAGDSVRFKAVNSYRAQAGAQYGHAFVTKGGSIITPFAGATYEYEFDSKARGTINDSNLDTPDIKGGTGIFETGLNVKPSANGSFSADIGVQGYAGKREGVSGRVQLKWTF